MAKFIKNKLGFFELENATKKAISYPETGNQDCYQMEEHSQWFNARNLTLSWVLKKFAFQGGFLDVGGGNGFQIHYLQKQIFDKKGIVSAMCEPGIEGCSNAAGREVKNVYACLFEDFPFEQYQIGAIGLFDVLEHIEDDVSFIKQIAHFLPKGGKIFVTVPALQMLWSKEDDYAGHFRRFNKKELNRLANKAGLKINYASYFFSYYTPLLWVVRVLPEKLGNVPTKEAIRAKEQNNHQQGKLLKSLLNVFHAMELSLMRFGIKIPFGTSMLFILEKE